MIIEVEQYSENDYAGLFVGGFSETVLAMKQQGFTLSSVADYARQRLSFGPYRKASWTGARTSDMFFCRDGKYYLAHTKQDKLMHNKMVSIMEKAHSQQLEIPLYEPLLSQSIEIPAHDFEILVAEMEKNVVAQFLFGQQLIPYKEWLQEIQIPFLPLMLPPYSLVRAHGPDFMRPLIMRCTDNWSGIITSNSDLHLEYGTRGDSTTYTGPIKKEEIFTVESLSPLKLILNLEEREYSRSEFIEHVKKQNLRDMTNALLRSVRAHSSLPANYSTPF